jgi:aminoglycoside phosphotransferase (APT) family kinase protein
MIAYPGLPGSELDPGALNSGELAAAAGQIASIILTLQRIPPGRFGLVDDVSARRERWARQRARVLPALREGFGPGEYDALCQWWEALLADDTMHDYAPVFHHGDLWYGNLLADGPRITAVLDWSDLGAGDPVLDFVPQKYPGEEFFNHVLAAFERAGGALPAGFHYRLARLRVLRELDGLEYAVLQNDAAEFDDSIIKLRREMGFS